MKVINIATLTAILFVLAGCASNHHLVFFTNTTIGLEVGSDPNGGSPAKFILGYKRQEGVIDPLIADYDFVSGVNTDIKEPVNGDTNIVMTPTGTAIPKGSITRAHSVLAKMNFGATGGGADAAAAQFFATGKAAELVAQAPGISGALSGDSKNNAVTLVDFTRGDDVAVFAHLDDVYKLLDKSTKEGIKTDRAKEIKSEVDTLDDGFFKVVFKNYYWTDGKKINLDIKDYDVKKDAHYFPNVYQYLETLSNSLKVAKEAVVKRGVTTSSRELTSAEKEQMVNDIEIFSLRYTEGEKILSSNKAVLEMIDHVYQNVLLTKSIKE